MSELREDTRQQIKLVLKEIPAHIAKLEVYDYSYYIDKILSIENLTIVDREAELPKAVWNMPLEMRDRKVQQDMLKEGWIKEIKT